MRFVLKSDRNLSSYYRGTDRDGIRHCDNVADAVVFDLSVIDGKFVSEPSLPDRDEWVVVPVSLTALSPLA